MDAIIVMSPEFIQEIDMRISKRTIKILVSKSERYFIWDDSLSGFGLRVEASGRKTFLCRYRIGNIRRQYTLGHYGNITPEEARRKAKKLLGNIAMGRDPAAERSDARKAITFSELFELILVEHGVKLKKTPFMAIDAQSTNMSYPQLEVTKPETSHIKN